MLDIFICVEDNSETQGIKELCLKYLVQENIDVDIKLFANEKSISKDETALYIIGFGQNFIKFASYANRRNPQNYIVAIISGLNELPQIILPSVRLSGFLLKPIKEESAFSLFNGIYADYSEACDVDVMFRFKIKAKEFSIPIKKIILFESSNKKIIIRTATQEFEYYDTLENAISLLPDTFIRTHKSFVVNIERISTVDYGGLSINMDDGSEAYLSRTYKSDFKKRFESLSSK